MSHTIEQYRVVPEYSDYHSTRYQVKNSKNKIMCYCDDEEEAVNIAISLNKAAPVVDDKPKDSDFDSKMYEDDDVIEAMYILAKVKTNKERGQIVSHRFSDDIDSLIWKAREFVDFRKEMRESEEWCKNHPENW